MSIDPKRTPSPERNIVHLTYPPRSLSVDSRTAQTSRVQTPLSTPMNDFATLESRDELNPEQPAFELAPVDRGKAAW
jgi:hypothetical protein